MEKKVIEPLPVITTRLVKSEDLNHHGTLFAGRTAEWFVESGFLAAASLVGAKSVVCLKIHGMYFIKPIRPGQILKFVSKVAYAGRTSLVSYIQVSETEGAAPYVSGFVTFVHVNEETQPSPHNIEISPVSEQDRELFEKAKNLKHTK